MQCRVHIFTLIFIRYIVNYLLLQYCCDSENDGFNTRVNDSIAMVKTTESLLELKNLFIVIIICLSN